jgi:uncharacterized protein YciI
LRVRREIIDCKVPIGENDMRAFLFAIVFATIAAATPVFARESKRATVADPQLAKQLGADAYGMRKYVLVILKAGPNRIPAGPARDRMFEGHLANIRRLAKAHKLVLSGPFGDNGDWRGLFVFAVETPDEAAALVATDPVIKSGEMIAEYHALYSTAALMAVTGIHEKIAPQ